MPGYTVDARPEVTAELADRPESVRQDYYDLIKELCWNPRPRGLGEKPEITLSEEDGLDDSFTAVFNHALLAYTVYDNAMLIRAFAVWWQPPALVGAVQG